jgi:hypothetical protein
VCAAADMNDRDIPDIRAMYEQSSYTVAVAKG